MQRGEFSGSAEQKQNIAYRIVKKIQVQEHL
jgi:hypothetical protein